MGASGYDRFTTLARALTDCRRKTPHGGTPRRPAPAAEFAESEAIRRYRRCEQSGKIAVSAIRSPFVPGTVRALITCAELEPVAGRG
jgi:hypothetical protein